MLRMSKCIWWYLNKYVILDLGFCVLTTLMELQKRGVYASAMIDQEALLLAKVHQGQRQHQKTLWRQSHWRLRCTTRYIITWRPLPYLLYERRHIHDDVDVHGYEYDDGSWMLSALPVVGIEIKSWSKSLKEMIELIIIFYCLWKKI